MWKCLLNLVGNGFGIFIAVGVGDKTFIGIIQTVLCIFFHTFHNRCDDLFLAADLVARDQMTGVVDI